MVAEVALELEQILRCDLCSSDRLTPEGSMVDTRLHTGERFHLARCEPCGLVMVSPRPTPAAIGAYYPDTYEPHNRSGAAAASWHRRATDRAGAGPLARALLAVREILSPWMIPVRQGDDRILDIGCATGQFLRIMRDLGWDTAGIELSPDAARAARAGGAHVEVAHADRKVFDDETFDVVHSSHLLEHTFSPRTTLEHVHAYLKPGGRLYLAVPNYGSLQRRLWGSYWCGAEVPRHLYFFTRTSLRLLLERAGFTDIRITTRTGANSWLRAPRLAMNGLLGTRWQREPKALEALCEVPMVVAGLFRFFGLGSELRVIARKPDAQR